MNAAARTLLLTLQPVEPFRLERVGEDKLIVRDRWVAGHIFPGVGRIEIGPRLELEPGCVGAPGYY